MEELPFDLTYDDGTVITMTVVYRFEAEVNLEALFAILPVIYLELEDDGRDRKHIKIPEGVGTPGDIVSITYKDKVRGLRRTNTDGFKHCITVDIITTERPISVKVSNNNMHTTGAKTIESATEAVEYLIAHIAKVEEQVRAIQNNVDAEAEAASEYLSLIVGEPTMRRRLAEIIKAEACDIHVYTMVPDYLLRGITEDTSPPLQTSTLTSLLQTRAGVENFYLTDLEDLATFVIGVPQAFNGDVTITRMNKYMINSVYNLGFEVDLYPLACLLNHNNGILARYDNTVDYGVTIDIPCDPDTGRIIDLTIEPEFRLRAKKKGGKITHHTITIYGSGKVTQSGPNEDYNRLAFDLIMSILKEHTDEVIQ